MHRFLEAFRQGAYKSAKIRRASGRSKVSLITASVYRLPQGDSAPDSQMPGAEPSQQLAQLGSQQSSGPPMVTPLQYLTDTPAMIDCPWCHRQTMTTTERQGNSMQVYVSQRPILMCPASQDAGPLASVARTVWKLTLDHLIEWPVLFSASCASV